MVLLVGSVFLFAKPDVVRAAGVPCSVTPVLSEVDLNTCIAEAPTDNSEFAITIGADFNITTQKTIAAGKNITLASVNPASPATLTRDPGFAGRLFGINIAAPNVVTLTIDSVAIDGNNPTAVANNQLIYTTGTGDITVNLTGSTVLENNNSASDGGGIFMGGSVDVLNIGSNVRIVNNTTAAYGGGIRAGSGGTINLLGGTIGGNTAANSGGGIRVQAGVEVNMYAGSTITGNTAGTNGGGVSNIGIFNFYGGEISGNTANAGGGVSVQGAAIASKFNMPAGSTGVIGGNTASVGGGVRIEAAGNTLDMAGGTIGDNTAENGGGVWKGEGTANITGGTISGNIATMNGGGVYTEDYNLLTVGTGAIFSGNRAAFSSPTRNPADNAVYAANILGINWTTPFTQGYNNYDINHNYAPDAPGTGAEPSGLGNGAVSLVGFGCAVVTIIVGMVCLGRRL